MPRSKLKRRFSLRRRPQTIQTTSTLFSSGQPSLKIPAGGGERGKTWPPHVVYVPFESVMNYLPQYDTWCCCSTQDTHTQESSCERYFWQENDGRKQMPVPHVGARLRVSVGEYAVSPALTSPVGRSFDF